MDFNRLLVKQKLYEDGKDTLHEVSIESLTLIETKVVLEDDISIGGKALRKIYEAVDHKKTFWYFKQCIQMNSVISLKITKQHRYVSED